jgi:ribonuclease T2
MSAQGLKAKHDLAAILAGVGILPSDTETYPQSSVRDAIVQRTV